MFKCLFRKCATPTRDQKNLNKQNGFYTDLGNDNKDVIVSSAIFRSVLMIINNCGDEGLKTRILFVRRM